MKNDNLKMLVESKGPEEVEVILCEAINDGELKAGEDLTFKEIWEAFMGEGSLNFDVHRGGFIKEVEVQEDAVRLSAFHNITGTLISSQVIEGYNLTPKIGDRLVTVYKTKLRDERFPGFTGAEAPREVKEGDAYEESGFGDKYVGTGSSVKMGRIISLTEEAIHFDQTGIILRRAHEIGEKAALEREKRILKGVLGIDNVYFPNGAVSPLYQAAPFVIANNALVDWTDIEKAEVDGLAEMTDDSPEQELIVVVGKVVIVPTAMKRTAQRIFKAHSITHGDFDDAASVKTQSDNPIKGEYEVLSSPLIHKLQIAAAVPLAEAISNWWFGDPAKQFWWKEIWPLQTFKANENNSQKFERDVVSRFKVRYFGNMFASDNRYVVKNKAS